MESRKGGKGGEGRGEGRKLGGVKGRERREGVEKGERGGNQDQGIGVCRVQGGRSKGDGGRREDGEGGGGG